MLLPSLVGGGVAGVLSGVPVVGMLNCLCCSLVVGGGFFASFLYSRRCRAAGHELRPATGATVGLIASLFYALASTLLSAVGILMTGRENVLEQAERDVANAEGQIGPEMADQILRAVQWLLTPAGMISSFFVMLLLAAVFSTLGGLAGGAVFKLDAASGEEGATRA